jgi:hypothetical protein
VPSSSFVVRVASPAIVDQASTHRPVLVEPRDVVVGAKERLDAVVFAGCGERHPVVPGHALLALDHECEPHEAEA